MNAVADKFEQFEWLSHGITAKSPQFSDEPHSTGERALDYQDRLGAIASMDTQLEKSITSVIIWGEKSQSDYEFVRNHLAQIMVNGAKEDKRREPENITVEKLAKLVARMVIDFSLNPDLGDNFTAKGRLYYAGVRDWQMNLKAYDRSWKQYEKTMLLCVELQIKCASEAIEKYKNQTYKELKA